MDKELILKKFQEHMGYTDEEMEIFKSDPVKVKTVTETPEFIKCRVIAEVIESHGCHAQHRVGDKFTLTPSGVLLTETCPKGVCAYALSNVTNVMPAINERLLSSSDPDFERFDIVQCTDIGLDKGGWGKILMKVYVEEAG